MKKDTMTVVLNFLLAGLVLLGVFFALRTIFLSRELRSLQYQVSQAQVGLMRQQSFFNDCMEYSKTHPAIDPVLEAVGMKTKPAPTTSGKPVTK